MKTIITLLLLAALSCGALAQTTSQVPNLMSNSTNAPSLQGGIDEIVQAFKDGTTNSYWVPYALYANGLKHHLGGGLGWFVPVNQYVVTGLRMDYVDGDFWMPSGNATLQLPINLSSGVTVTPLAYAGVGVPVSGATFTAPVIGNVTVPGAARDNNGQPTAILGIGASIRLYTGTDWSLSGVGDVEEWTGFPGKQYRAGIAYHSNKPGLFGIGLNLGVIKL